MHDGGPILRRDQRGSASKCIFHLGTEIGLRIFGERAKVGVEAMADPNFGYALHKARQEFLVYGSLYVKALHRDTYVPCIGKSAIGDSFDRPLDVTVSKDEAGVLAAKLQNRWNEVLRGLFRNLLAVTATAGEEYEVRVGFDEGCGLHWIVVEDLHQMAWQACLRTDCVDEIGRFRRALGTLENRRIAGNEGSGKRDQGKLQGIIRRAENQSNAVWLEVALEVRAPEEEPGLADAAWTEDSRSVRFVIP